MAKGSMKGESDGTQEPLAPPDLVNALRELHKSAPELSPERGDAIIATALRSFHRTERRRRLIRKSTPWAVAASIMIAVIVWPERSSTPAFGQVASAVARQFIDSVPIEVALKKADPILLARLTVKIEDARAQRDEALSRLASAQSQGDTKTEKRAAADLRVAREDFYRRLRDVGRFPEALAEVDESIRFADQRKHDEPGWLGLLCVARCDRGDILAAAHDYVGARETYQENLKDRLKHVGDLLTPIGIQGAANTLTPLYWRLHYIALAQGDLDEAQRELNNAENILRTYVLAVCRDRGIQTGNDASLIEAFRMMPSEFQNPPEWPSTTDEENWQQQYGAYRPSAVLIVKVHEHLYRLVRLRRVEGNFDRATEALRDLQTLRAIAEYRDRDESRLPFFVPLEAARLAIAYGDYDGAIPYTDEASKHIDDLNFYGRELGVVPRAELRIFRGSALISANRDLQKGCDEINLALTLPHKVASSLTERQRAAFAVWELLGSLATREKERR